MAKATFGAGNFWNVEEALRHLTGVISTTVGYMGGTTQNPTHEEVSEGKTGHAQVVQVEFDPVHIEYEDLLEAFWSCHDPTSLNRQGHDVGPAYRSVIFFHNSEQKQLAQESLQKIRAKLGKRIMTEIVPTAEFYPADEQHQRYLEKHGLIGSPVAVA